MNSEKAHRAELLLSPNIKMLTSSLTHLPIVFYSISQCERRRGFNKIIFQTGSRAGGLSQAVHSLDYIFRSKVGMPCIMQISQYRSFVPKDKIFAALRSQAPTWYYAFITTFQNSRLERMCGNPVSVDSTNVSSSLCNSIGHVNLLIFQELGMADFR